jgi:hypothetical protein
VPKLKKVQVYKNVNHKYQSALFKEGWKIYPLQCSGGWNVRYERGGQGKLLNNGAIYSPTEAYQEIWNLYEKIYKHLKQK